MSVLNEEIVSGLLMIKREGFFANIVSVYERDANRLLGELETVSDPKSLEEIAHALKSASVSIGAHLVGEEAFVLETAGREGTMPDVAAGLAKVRVRFDEALVALKDRIPA